MELKTYEQMSVELEHYTLSQKQVVMSALYMTMHKDPDKDIPAFTSKLGKYLLDAEHTSPLEHVSYMFRIEGVSRSFLAQITRHRMGSFTSASQHYQDYQDYPCIIDKLTDTAVLSLHHSYNQYEKLLKDGMPKEEARQVLPNAAAVNLLWTVNARSLITFLKQRLCMRNVKEMQIFANKVLSLVTPVFPEIFNHVGPQCFKSMCKQGRLECGVGPWVRWNK